MSIDPGSKTAQVCRTAILHDAKAWARSGPRYFVRNDNTQLRAAERNANDTLFAEQNAEWDDTMMTFYETRYARYGGDLNDLPWITNGERASDVG